MPSYRRRLPHISEIDQPVFLTWRLHGSLPPNRVFHSLSSGRAFVAFDRLLDHARLGPTYLAHPKIAAEILESFRYAESTLKLCQIHSFVVMPNHVHLSATPRVELSRLTKAIKNHTAKRANLILGLTGSAFWQDETYDHCIRSQGEAEKIKAYIENNPVTAGLAATPQAFPWSSAHGAL